MEINTNLNAGKVGVAPTGQSPTRAVKAEREDVAFNGAATLEQALRDTPEKRTEAIERAFKLLGDPTYPPRETLDRIANLLAMRDSTKT